MDVLLISPDHLAQLEEHLLLMRRILSEAVPPARRRGWLTEQCRRRGDDERELWRALARYRQTGAAGLLTADRPRPTRFGRSHELVREGVLTRLIDTPRCVLGEFGPLAQLLEELGDRLAFLCSWVLEFFLDPEPRLETEADHLQVTLEVLLQKLAEEIERLREIYEQGPCLSLHDVLCDYRDWLCRRALVDECEDLE